MAVITLINLDQLFICSCFFQLLFILKHDSSAVQLCSKIFFLRSIHVIMVRICQMTHWWLYFNNMSKIGTEQETHSRKTHTRPLREGGYYEDSDVATHFTSAMCYRQTDMGAASHSTASDPASAPPRWVSPHSEMRRRSLRQIAAPSALRQGPRAYQRQRYVSDKSKEAVQKARGKTEGRWKGWRRSEGGGMVREEWGRLQRVEVREEGVDVMQRNEV